MTVFLNEQIVNCNEADTIAQLLSQQNIDTSNMAIAVDDIVIRKEEWAKHKLKNNCKILLIKATQGG